MTTKASKLDEIDKTGGKTGAAAEALLVLARILAMQAARQQSTGPDSSKEHRGDDEQ